MRIDYEGRFAVMICGNTAFVMRALGEGEVTSGGSVTDRRRRTVTHPGVPLSAPAPWWFDY